MEITIDIGKHTYQDLAKYAASEDKEIDVFASEILDLGLRIYKANQSSSEEDTAIDEKERLLIENNRIVKEVMRCVFEKTKTSMRVFDANTLVTMVENETDAFLRGKAKQK
ncbi:hypothetical protein [Cysteiniphilum marinum]|uniref:hypothetical protein n=1 Tax=Cysteiniphilum marinum TaxID=2774191 RepID=UPI00193A78A0|nr:hypothetical protein [Cysteiniphilum marinum]